MAFGGDFCFGFFWLGRRREIVGGWGLCEMVSWKKRAQYTIKRLWTGGNDPRIISDWQWLRSLVSKEFRALLLLLNNWTDWRVEIVLSLFGIVQFLLIYVVYIIWCFHGALGEPEREMRVNMLKIVACWMWRTDFCVIEKCAKWLSLCLSQCAPWYIPIFLCLIPSTPYVLFQTCTWRLNQVSSILSGYNVCWSFFYPARVTCSISGEKNTTIYPLFHEKGWQSG